jgi:membrane protease YdiL (CAAX protease family)
MFEARVHRWRWWIHLVLIGGYPALAVPAAFHNVLSHRPALSGTAGGLITVCVVQIAMFAALFGAAWSASRASPDELFLRWAPGWWVMPLGIAYSLAIRVALGLVVLFAICLLLGAHVITPDSIQTILRRPSVERLVDVSALRTDPAYFWLTLTVVSFVNAGLREEVWRAGTLAALRALWPKAFGSWWGQVAAISLIAVVFGAGHLAMGVLAAIAAGLLGLFLGVIIVVHKSIWPAVIAHGLFDATTFALLPQAFEKLQHFH